MTYLLYLVLVVIKSPTYGILGQRSLKYRGLRRKKGLILCKINSIIHIHLSGKSTILILIKCGEDDFLSDRRIYREADIFIKGNGKRRIWI